MDERLYRTRDDRMIGGVAGGLARSLRVDPTLVRIAWVILAFVTNGVAVLVYLVLLFVIPEEPWVPDSPADSTDATTPGAEPVGPSASNAQATGTGPTSPTASSPAPPRRAGWWNDRYRGPSGVAPRDDGRTGALVIGLILVAVGGSFLVRQYLPQIDFGQIWPYVAVGLGVVLLAFSLIGGRRSG